MARILGNAPRRGTDEGQAGGTPRARPGHAQRTWHTLSMLVPPGYPIGSPQVIA
jgi:hypothetical protein